MISKRGVVMTPRRVSPVTLTESLLAALLLATAGAGHCLAMCGALSMNISFAVPATQRQGSALLRWHVLVNTGRVALYALLGALSGGFGAVIKQQAPGLMRGLIILASLVLMLMALQLLGRAAGVRRLEAFGQGLWRRVQPLTSALLPLRHGWQALLLGALWGFLPCGLIYSALLLASASASALQGALMMMVFGIATAVPVATSGIVAGRLSVLRRPLWRGLAAAASLIMAAYLAWQALMPMEHAGHGSATPAAGHHSHHPGHD